MGHCSGTRNPSRVNRRWSGAVTLAATIFAGASVGVPVFAQAPPAAQVLPSTYRIAVEDTLDISVLDHPDVSRTYQILPDGTIQVPYAGTLNVVGLTRGELKTRLTKAFAKEFYKPEVIVGIRTVQQSVNVVGLTHGGNFPLKQGNHLIDIISAAGGLPFPRPEAFKATLIRATGEAVPIDVEKLFQNDASQNPIILPGDTVYVEEKEAAQTTVQVLGQVEKPGPVIVPRDHSVITILQAVGGPTPAAALSQVVLDHGGKQVVIDLRNYRQTGFEPTEKIEAGDRLIVPENKNIYYIFGGGEHTGAQVYPDDTPLTVYSAIARAGATTEGVDLTKVKLIRPLEGGQTKTTLVNVQKMLKTGDFSADLPIQPKDTIYVPAAGNRKGLSFGEVIGIFSGVVGILYYFKRR